MSVNKILVVVALVAYSTAIALDDDDAAPFEEVEPRDEIPPKDDIPPMDYMAPMDMDAPKDEAPMDSAPMDMDTPVDKEVPMDEGAPMDSETPMDSVPEDSPVDDETPVPTPSPTPMPTPSPTPSPTPAPTPAPTPSPTPAPTPAPTPMPTPAPTPEPTPVPPTYCSSNKLCTANGDTAATCVDGKCVCGLGYEILTVDGVKLEKDGCYKDGTDLATVRLTRFITIRFGAGVFSRLSPAAKDFLLSFLRALFNLLNHVLREGSIIVGAKGDVSVADAAGLEPAALTAKWAEAVVNETSMSDVFGDPAEMTVAVAGEGASDCPAVAGVAEQLKLGDECIPFECMAGFKLSSADPPVCVLPSSSDDDLSGGQIAGIVIGTMAFVVIVAVGIFFVCCRKSGTAVENHAPAQQEPAQQEQEVHGEGV